MDITQFCARSYSDRHYLSTPFREGENVIATNGHIMVVVPGLAGDYPPIPANIANKALDFETSFHAAGETHALGTMTLPDRVDCVHCAGNGHIYVTPCIECDGEGEFHHGSHFYECKECRGAGALPCHENQPGAKAQECDRCFGFGERTKAIEVGASTFMRRYLALIAELPNSAITPSTHAQGIARFSFDGGHGFLMPCLP